MQVTRYLALFALLLTPVGHAHAQYVAEQVTAGNAGARLFGGTDADGGVSDWYLSNGVIEAIVDDAGPQTDLPPGVTPPPKQSEAAFSGGSLIDLGLAGADNDQLSVYFAVGGFSLDNFVVYDSIATSTTPTSATVTATGTVLGFDPLSGASLPVVTEYIAADSDSFLTIRTTVTNSGATAAVGLGGFLDVIPWTTRAIVPFSPLPDRGFKHVALDVSNPAAALELPVFAAGPGNVSPADGMVDTATGTPSGEVAYGLLGVELTTDPDGPGGTPPTVAPVNTLFGVSGVQATAFGHLPAGAQLDPGASITFERRLYVGGQNDVASVTNLMLPDLTSRLGFATGTLSGDVDAVDTTNVAASVIATRTSGPAIAGIADGAPITHFRTDSDGIFSGVVVPEGTYSLEVRAINRDPVVVAGVAVSPSTNTAVATPLLSGLGTLLLEVKDKVKGPDPLVPAKVVIRGIDGTPDPQFGKDFEALEVQPDSSEVDLNPETFGGALAQGTVVYLPDGTGSVQLRPGKYEAFASRGLEYTLHRRKVRIREGREKRSRFGVRRVVETNDALSADFHVHSARSFDTSATPVGRVAAFAGEGVEVMVATDHDFVLDYAPVISALGAGDLITSISGTELTSTAPNPPTFPGAVGHVNGWPLAVDPIARRDGSPEDEYVAPNFLFSRLRTAGAEVVQYNHPRAGVRGFNSIGFFNVMGCNRCEVDIDTDCLVDTDCPAPQACTCAGYRPERAITSPPNDVLLDDDVTGASGVSNPGGVRNLDFDVMEIGNGLNNVGYLQVREDWFSLLNQRNLVTPSGSVPFIPGTGVSDSHRNTLESAGYFRTYVLESGESPSGLDVTAFNGRVKDGRMMATSGPYIEFSLSDAAGTEAVLGETLAPSTSQVTVTIRVQSTNWLPVDEVRIIANGSVLLTFDENSTPPVKAPRGKPWSGRKKVVRFEHTFTFGLSEDTWLLVEAGAPIDPLPDPDAFIEQIVPGLVPLAFTNPIFVDLGGDGFDPPGVGSVSGGSVSRKAAAEHRRHETRDHFPLRKLEFPEKLVAELEALR